MAKLSYQRAGLVLARGVGPDPAPVRDLQHDLRALGYLKQGIDGKFGSGTERAVRALQYDLLHNHGRSTQADGRAPVRVLDYNKGRVVDINGVLDQGLAGCLRDLLEDTVFPKLPESQDPVSDNRRIVAEIDALPAGEVPVPFLHAMLMQESGLKHFNEPRGEDSDRFITVGLDTNAGQKHIITSRGYGAGQYTLFHHPPRAEEVSDFMLDVAKNLGRASNELREKFDHFVVGPSSGTRADDRIAEAGAGPLRLCKFSAGDPHFLRDCRACAEAAAMQEIRAGITPLFKGSAHRFEPTQYYRVAVYQRVPIRAGFPCDWPYAARRYNGAGINSYHYQVRILQNLLKT